MQIFEGYYAEGREDNLIFGLCSGINEPADVVSEGNVLTVAFKSDGNDISGRGFRIQYKTREFINHYNCGYSRKFWPLNL